MIGALAVIVAVIGAGLPLGWFSYPPSNCSSGVTLDGEGASLLLPLMSEWEGAFRANGSDAVNYNPAGAGAAISSLSARAVDFAATDEPLSASEYKGMPGTVLTLPVTGGALAIVYHLPGVVAPLELSGDVLANVYLGTVARWDDSAIRSLNPGVVLPSQTIITVHRSDAAGTTYVLTDYLSEDSSTWKEGPGTGLQPSWPSSPEQHAEQGNSKVVQYVAATPYSVGYADLTDVLGTPGLQYARMENPAQNFVLPTALDTASAIADRSRNTTFPSASGSWSNISMVNSPAPGDYPLATLSYFLTFQTAELGLHSSLARTDAIQQWLHWVLQAGQALSGGLDYATLPSNLVALDEAAIGTITFDGNTVSCGLH
ncbi:MAG: phosphate ABC transporter substrate-binding protein PstS [Thermoplasmata archaeon]|nr:phosphate ABC transporter substrate-binding protein PstS [Thermoplasmata archaeon]MCI4359246.1 phosphate ABC transporter substrate-binding protein PstS [Thermoplasmata archaeon]